MQKKQKQKLVLIARMVVLNMFCWGFFWVTWQMEGIDTLFEPTVWVITRPTTTQAEAIHTKTPETEKNLTQGSITAKNTIQKVANEEGIDWKILYAICMEESGGCKAGEIGDGGKSFGWFQIHSPSHPEIKKEQAFDLEWSAHWTAQRLKNYAKIGGWDYAIRKHNGNADIATGQWEASYKATERYLVRVKNNIAKL